MFNEYPYTDYHELNTDWIIGKIKNVETAEANTKQYAEDADAAKIAAQDAQTAAENAQTAAEDAQRLAENARDSAQGSASDAADVVSDTLDQIELLQARVDNIIPDGTQTVGNTELLDIRVGYDGTTYDSAGNAVRKQVSLVEDKLEAGGIVTEALASPTITNKYVVPGTGAISNIGLATFAISDFTLIPDGATTIFLKDTPVNNASIALIAFYGSNTQASFISAIAPTGIDIEATIPSGAKYYIISSNVDAVGTVQPLTVQILVKNNNIVAMEKAAPLSKRDETPDFTANPGKYIFDDGSLRSNAYFDVSDFISINDSDTVIEVNATNIVDNAAIGMVAFYTSAVASAATCLGVIKPAGLSIIQPIPYGTKYILIGSNTNVIGITTPIDGYYRIYSDANILPIKEYMESNSVSIKAPDTYDLVVGDTFELFYKGIIESYADKEFFVDAECNKGSNYERKFVFTPSAAGDTTLTLNLYNEYMRVMDSKNITLSVHNTPSSPLSNKNILCIGDSLTVHGEWVKEFKRRLTASGGTPAGFNLNNISFVGTCEVDNTKFEGYGGWTFNSYNTANVNPEFKYITCTHDKTEADDQHSIYEDANGSRWKLETIEAGQIKIILTSGTSTGFPASGTLTWVSGGVHHSNIVYSTSTNAPGNPFWDNDANQVDFSTYASNLGISSIDYVYILLGWNSAGAALSTTKSDAQTLITNIHASFPSAKIVLMGLQIPARDGLGANYGATGTWSKYLNLVKYVHGLDDVFDDLADNNANVYHINISGQFDTEHNMPESTRPVNTRNAETETYQSNGVHPALSGYLQIADAATRNMTGII